MPSGHGQPQPGLDYGDSVHCGRPGVPRGHLCEESCVEDQQEAGCSLEGCWGLLLKGNVLIQPRGEAGGACLEVAGEMDSDERGVFQLVLQTTQNHTQTRGPGGNSSELTGR